MAIFNINDAKKCWVETCLELGRPVLEPLTGDFSGQLRIRMPKSLHRILSEKAREENISLNQYINYQLAGELVIQQQFPKKSEYQKTLI